MFFLKGNSLLIFSLLVGLSYGQNLVPNGSFEEFINCPNTDMAPEDCPPWFTPTNATSDVFNRCNPMGFDSLTVCPLDTGNTYLDPWIWAVPVNTLGCQEPRTGDGYAGIFLYHTQPWREYIQVPLTESLNEGDNYFIRIYVSCADRMHYSTDAFHIGFVEDSVHYDTEFNIDFGIDLENESGNLLDDQDNWMELSWEYIADGTENFLVIGNFNNDDNILLDSINPIEDFYLASYYYIDDVFVGKSIEDDIVEEKIANDIIIISNPIGNSLELDFDFTSQDWYIEILNCLGQVVLQQTPLSHSYDLSHLSRGYYLLRTYKNRELINTHSFIKKNK